MTIHVSNIVSKSEQDTQRAAQDLAKTLHAPQIIALNGTLGMGKTVFARALIQTLCNQSNLEVVSPTFTLVQSYDADIGTIYHYDLYRIETPDEILELGWEDSIYDSIVIVEWPERLGAYTPREYLDITFSSSDNSLTHRHIEIKQV